MMNTKKSAARFVTRTALGVALVLLAQIIGKLLPAGAVIAGPFSLTQLVTGSLVNCVLFVFAAQAGLLSGVIIGILSSVLAFLVGIGPVFPAITPVIACGNALLVIVFCLACGKSADKLRTAGSAVLAAGSAVLAAVIKCGFLWLAVPAVLRMLGNVPDKQMAALSIMFSWPQGLTALLGATLALIILPRLRKAKNT